MNNLFNYFNIFSVFGKKVSNLFLDYSGWKLKNILGVMKIKSLSNKYNATSYFGQGVYFDGISQRVDIADALRPVINRSSFSVSVNIVTNASTDRYLNFLGTADVQLMGNGATQLAWSCYSGVENKLFYPNNLLTGLFTLTYDGTTYRAYHNGVLITSVVGAPPISSSDTLCIGGRSRLTNYRQATQKDMFIFNRVLTDVEIMNAYMYPNEFYQMAQADGLCILNMPLCEKDGFVRNYKTYTEVQKEYSNFNDGTTMGFTGLYGATVSNVGNKLKVTAVVNNPYVGKQYTAVVGNYYRIRCKILKTSDGGGELIVGSTAGLANSDLGYAGPGSLNVETDIIKIVKATTTILQCNVRGAGMTAGDYFTIDNWEVTDLGTSIYPITNFTAACRTSAQRLTSGLQTSGFKRDTSGTILSKSNYLEGDGVGYADTGYIVDTTKDFTIEYIHSASTNNFFLGNKDTTLNSRISFNTYLNLTLYVKFGSNEIYKIGLTQLQNKHIVATWTKATNTVSVYINGVFVVGGVTTFTDSTTTIDLNRIENNNTYISTDALRLFKVHKKALTASQVLANYNKYVAKGLLS